MKSRLTNSFRLAVLTLAGLLLTSGQLNAGITVTQTSVGSPGTGGSASAGIWELAVSPNSGASKSLAFDVINPRAVLVVGVYLDGATPSLSDISFGGQSPDGIINDPRGFLFYFLKPTTDSGKSITFTANGASAGAGGAVAWELDGVDLAATPVNSTNDTITTTAAKSLVVSLGWKNNAPPMASNSQPTGFTMDMYGSDHYNGIAGAHATIATPGSVDVNWASDDYGSPASFAFTPATAGTVVIIR